MQLSTSFGLPSLAAAIVCLAVATSTQAAPLIANGGFEAGLASWTTVDQVGGDGTFFVQAGTLSPLNATPVPAPPQGAQAAMTDSFGPGAHLLYQDFVVSGNGGILGFSLFIGNLAGQFAIPPGGSLDFALTNQIGSQTLNQQARVDILSAGADPFSVAATDVLLTLFQTNIGDSLVSGYTDYAFDISSLFAAHAGETLRLRFAETDNVGPFQFGVDNVRIETVPEPATTLLVVAGLLATLLAGGARLRRVL